MTGMPLDQMSETKLDEHVGDLAVRAAKTHLAAYASGIDRWVPVSGAPSQIVMDLVEAFNAQEERR